MTQRCASHHLAVGPDGLCVLCRREAQATEAAPAPEAAGDAAPLPWLPIAVAAVFGLFFVGGLVGAAFLLARASEDDIAAVDETLAERGPRRGRAVQQPGGGATDQAADDEAAPQNATEAALAAARDEVHIELFSAPWCPACRSARAYLDSEGISYDLHDVDEDPAAAQRLRQLNPRGSIPVLLFDGENPMVGFSPAGVTNAIDRAARKRISSL